jgi:hypothetical protein
MRTHRRHGASSLSTVALNRAFACLGGGLLLAACGAPAPAAAPTGGPPSTGSSAGASSAPSVAAAAIPSAGVPKAVSSDVPSAEPEPTKAPDRPTVAAPAPETSPGPTRSPVEILTLPAIAFQIDYDASAPRHRAEAACKADAKDTSDVVTTCLQKARDQFVADVVRIKKAKGGNWSLFVYRRTEHDLREVYSALVEISDDSPTTARLKWKGGERGTRPFFKGRPSGIVAVPNDYTLELDDAQLGKLVYGAKTRLVAD